MTEPTADRVRPVGACLLIVTMLLLLAALGRVVQLQVNPPPQLAQYAGSTTSNRHEIARRGTITDRQGRILASSRVGYRLFADPHLLERPEALGSTLSDLAGLDAEEIDRKLAAAGPDRRYVVLSHLLDDGQLLSIEQHRIPGLGLQPRMVREYPAGDVATALLGVVGFEHEGRLGAEFAFEEQLSGEAGHIVYARDARRRALWVEPTDHVAARSGAVVQLSIDLVLQTLVEEELEAAVAEANAGGGRAVVVDPQTGEILAMADILREPQREEEGFLPFTTDPDRAKHLALGRFRCVTDVYEPGSTFKVFMWAAMTELGLAQIDEIIDCQHGAWRVPYGRRVLHDAFPKDELTWHEVLVQSSNIGMGQIAERMSPAQMQQAVRRFGFGSKTNLGLPGETIGIITSPQAWTRYSQTSIAMGQEIAVTPVQLIRAFCVFARSDRQRGTLPYLRLTKMQAGAAQPPQVRVLPPDVVDLAKAAMAEVGVKLDDKLKRRGIPTGPHPLFGKSGTPQLPNSVEGGYHDDRYVSSFIAAAPVDEPRIAVLVVIDDPDKAASIGHFGSSVAGPAVRRIVDRTLAYIGMNERETMTAQSPAD